MFHFCFQCFFSVFSVSFHSLLFHFSIHCFISAFECFISVFSVSFHRLLFHFSIRGFISAFECFFLVFSISFHSLLFHFCIHCFISSFRVSFQLQLTFCNILWPNTGPKTLPILLDCNSFGQFVANWNPLLQFCGIRCPNEAVQRNFGPINFCNVSCARNS